MTSSPKLGLADLGTALVFTEQRAATGTTRTTVQKRPARTAGTTPTPASMVRTRPITPTATVRLVSGTVTYFNEERGFGFAHAIVDGTAQKVFFHVNNARVAAGTADAPELTDEEFKDVYVTASRPRPTEIMMIVRPSDDPSDPRKKATATKWGIRPERDWRDDAIRFDNGYADYVGGHVAILPHHGSYGTEEFRGGTVQAIKLTRGEINIVITDAYRFDPTTGTWTTPDTVAVCYRLKYAHLDAKNERTPERNRRKVIIAPSIHDKTKRIRLILDKPAIKATQA